MYKARVSDSPVQTKTWYRGNQPFLGSHFTIWFSASKQALSNTRTDESFLFHERLSTWWSCPPPKSHDKPSPQKQGGRTWRAGSGCVDKEPVRRVICFQHRVFAGRLQLAVRVFCCKTNDCRPENIKFYQVCLELVEINVQGSVKPAKMMRSKL